MTRRLLRLFVVLMIPPVGCTYKSSSEFTTRLNDTTILHADTTIIDGTTYEAMFRTDEILYIIRSGTDTILQEPDLFYQFEFTDFDGDGRDDLLVSYIGNVPTKDLLLFDTTTTNFKKVLGFTNYPETQSVPGTRYYSSYQRMGCADMNWESDLFFIDHFTAKSIGNIRGVECEGETQGIFVSRTNANQKIPIETYPVETTNNYPNGKRDFIKEYWAQNYIRFE